MRRDTLDACALRTESRQSPVGAVASTQRLLVPQPVVDMSTEGARTLGAVYWKEVQRFTQGVVRSRVHEGGVELRLVGRAVLLRLGPPTIRSGGGVVICRYRILGGLLVRVSGGTISFAQLGGDRPELRSRIIGFFPRLAARPRRPNWTGTLYAQVQARVHAAVGRRYFARLLRGDL